MNKNNINDLTKEEKSTCNVFSTPNQIILESFKNYDALIYSSFKNLDDIIKKGENKMNKLSDYANVETKSKNYLVRANVVEKKITYDISCPVRLDYEALDRYFLSPIQTMYRDINPIMIYFVITLVDLEHCIGTVTHSFTNLSCSRLHVPLKYVIKKESPKTIGDTIKQFIKECYYADESVRDFVRFLNDSE